MSNNASSQDSGHRPSSPHVLHVGEPSKRRAASRDKHSGLGIAASIIAIGVIVLALATSVITSGPTASRAFNAPLNIFYIFALGVGTGLGGAGLLQEHRRKALAMLGVVLNTMIWLLIEYVILTRGGPGTVGP